MEKYRREFQETRSQVYRETSRFTRLAVPITILFVLFLLNLAAYAVWAQSWENRLCSDGKIKSRISWTPIKPGWINFWRMKITWMSGYYQANSLYYTDAFDQYRAVLQGADALGYVFEQLQYTFSSSVTPWEEELSDLANSLSSLLPQIYQVERKTTPMTGSSICQRTIWSIFRPSRISAPRF